MRFSGKIDIHFTYGFNDRIIEKFKKKLITNKFTSDFQKIKYR